MLTYWSPLKEGLFMETIPLPRSRILLPDCIPAGTLQITFPYKVCTDASPPKTAVVKGTDTLVYTSCPFLVNPGFWAICTFRRRFPAEPPPIPGIPLPLSRMLFPSSMPAGICTFKDCTLPLPSALCSRITLSQPRAASSKVMLTSDCRSPPWLCLLR